MDVQKLKRLKLNRRVCISEIECIKQLSIKAKSDKSVRSLFRVRFSEIEDIRREFLKHHNNIVTLLLGPEGDEGIDLDIAKGIREDFLNDYFEAKSFFSELYNPEENGVNIIDSSTRNPASRFQECRHTVACSRLKRAYRNNKL
ncbi:hypothetical protein HHI36_023796 [Cryptolaemus montrouzieri]|uniref:Uncharacterized protein n=1 Tax=Cryptolaemus montrouzieri TaxID=559131 RepID=A0ABD2PJI2_9CUCU